jgi:hypothetical protein
MCRLSLLQPRLSAFLASELVVPLPSRRPSIDRLATSTICRNCQRLPHQRARAQADDAPKVALPNEESGSLFAPI